MRSSSLFNLGLGWLALSVLATPAADAQHVTNAIVRLDESPPSLTLYGVDLGSQPGEIIFALAGVGVPGTLLEDWSDTRLRIELPTSSPGDYLVAVRTAGGDTSFFDFNIGQQVAVANFAPPQETGQSECFDGDGDPMLCAGTGMDGEIRLGVKWPVPRWEDRADGTVLDRLTGIIWLQDWECLGRQNWDVAMALAATLGDGVCGLSGGYRLGDFVPPSINQLMSLIDYGETNGFPADFPIHFIPGDVWSSTSYQPLPLEAWTFGSTTVVKSYQVPKIKGQGNKVAAVYRPTQ